jgi:hypothetical protein
MMVRGNACREESWRFLLRGNSWASNSIHHYLPDCDWAERERVVFLWIVPGSRKQFFALCQACAKALLLPWKVWRRLSLPIGVLPKVGAGE